MSKTFGGVVTQEDGTVILRKPVSQKKVVQTRAPDGGTNTNANSGIRKSKKLDDPDYIPEKVPQAFKDQIMKGRQTKGMTQKELAAKLCIKPADVQAYENGSLKPPGPMISKINKALGITLKKHPGKK